MSKTIILSDVKIINKIYFIRRKKVMIDRDLAEIYGVETKVLNQAVKRNAKRFPDDFTLYYEASTTHISFKHYELIYLMKRIPSKQKA